MGCPQNHADDVRVVSQYWYWEKLYDRRFPLSLDLSNYTTMEPKDCGYELVRDVETELRSLGWGKEWCVPTSTYAT